MYSVFKLKPVGNNLTQVTPYCLVESSKRGVEFLQPPLHITPPLHLGVPATLRYQITCSPTTSYERSSSLIRPATHLGVHLTILHIPLFTIVSRWSIPYFPTKLCYCAHQLIISAQLYILISMSATTLLCNTHYIILSYLVVNIPCSLSRP